MDCENRYDPVEIAQDAQDAGSKAYAYVLMPHPMADQALAKFPEEQREALREIVANAVGSAALFGYQIAVTTMMHVAPECHSFDEFSDRLHKVAHAYSLLCAEQDLRNSIEDWMEAQSHGAEHPEAN